MRCVADTDVHFSCTVIQNLAIVTVMGQKYRNRKTVIGSCFCQRFYNVFYASGFCKTGIFTAYNPYGCIVFFAAHKSRISLKKNKIGTR